MPSSFSSTAQTIAKQALTSGRAVFSFDSPDSVFHPHLKQLSETSDARLYELQDRIGAGDVISGFVSAVEREAFEDGSQASNTPQHGTVYVFLPTSALALVTQSLLQLSQQSPSQPTTRPNVVVVASSLSHFDSDGVLRLRPALTPAFKSIKGLREQGWAGDVQLSDGRDSQVPERVAANTTTTDAIWIVDGLESANELRKTSSVTSTSNLDLDQKSETVTALVIPSSHHAALATAAKAALPSIEKSHVILPIQQVVTKSIIETFTRFQAEIESSGRKLSNVLVFDEGDEGGAQDDLLCSAILAAPSSSISSKVSSFSVESSFSAWIKFFDANASSEKLESLLPDQSKLVSFWSSDSTQAAEVPLRLSQTFLQSEQHSATNAGSITPRLLSQYDAYNVAENGVQSSLLLLSAGQDSTHPVSSIAETVDPSLLVISSPETVLKGYDPIHLMLQRRNQNQSRDDQPALPSTVLFSSSWAPEEFDIKLSPSMKRSLALLSAAGRSGKRKGGLFATYTINPDAILAALPQGHGYTTSDVLQAAFWNLYLSSVSDEVLTHFLETSVFASLPKDIVSPLVSLVRSPTKGTILVPIGEGWEEGEVPGGIEIHENGVNGVNGSNGVTTLADNKKMKFDVHEEETNGVNGVQKETNGIHLNGTNGATVVPARLDSVAEDVYSPSPVALPSSIIANSVFPSKPRSSLQVVRNPSPSQAWHTAAQRLLFPDCFALAPRRPKHVHPDPEHLRPDLPDRNYLVTVTENRRLTPSDYDRNVFHVEFSTAGTGLKYEIGEALGIHGWNDSEEVTAFLDWYGLNPSQVVDVPSRSDSEDKLEQRTLFQLFQQNLDIFGKPPKSFYEALAASPTSPREESRILRFMASEQGSSMFKKWSETDTVTYADVLKAFPKSKEGWGVSELVKEIGPIKERHYSIASSQNAVGDSVHLLVVTVDWQTPKGTARYGQCTRYLAQLKVGDQVMVSIKPSVMKLPPLDTQPIIMAGLGTGAAPFRAFLQERAWRRENGIEVGPMAYYFGSRYSSKEYLYGEEIEAYIQDGILTHTGMAFSRDGPNKVYIQDKMKQDGELLTSLLDEGAFYLCGPTWPVPDVYDALVAAYSQKGKTQEEAAQHIEDLKEAERYVLEVY